MTHALFMTAYDRPSYFDQALESWSKVRGLEHWRFVIRIEPGDFSDVLFGKAVRFLKDIEHPNAVVVVNPRRYGVLHHPWVGFEDLFRDYDFVVRTEDDLRVSADILEYFEWAENEFYFDPDVATIHGFTTKLGKPDVVQAVPIFNPLVWGTWRAQWEAVISPEWDHDYSTNNGTPGQQAGWDWNLNTRIFPREGWLGVYPEASRVDNIGIMGTHSTPENYFTSESFREDHGKQQYRVLTEPKDDIT